MVCMKSSEKVDLVLKLFFNFLTTVSKVETYFSVLMHKLITKYSDILQSNMLMPVLVIFHIPLPSNYTLSDVVVSLKAQL